MNFDQTDFFAALGQLVDRFFNRFGHGAHRDDDAFRIRCAVISERCVFAAGMLADLLHVVGNDIRDRFIMQVLRFTALEINVVVFRTAAGYRVGMRVQRLRTERFNRVHVDQAL